MCLGERRENLPINFLFLFLFLFFFGCKIKGLGVFILGN